MSQVPETRAAYLLPRPSHQHVSPLLQLLLLAPLVSTTIELLLPWIDRWLQRHSQVTDRDSRCLRFPGLWRRVRLAILHRVFDLPILREPHTPDRTEVI